MSNNTLKDKLAAVQNPPPADAKPAASNLITITQLMTRSRDQFAKALPKHLSVERVLRVAMTELRNNQKLQQCTPISFLSSVMKCAQLGLEPGSGQGHAYLIPYKTECTMQIGYRGMIDIARRSGEIVSINARPVYANDKFDYSYGLCERLEHVPARENAGDLRYVYAVAALKGGGHQFEVMSVEQVNNIRNRSEGYKSAIHWGKSHPWITDYVEMARKTAVRRLYKYLPTSIEMRQAFEADDAEETGMTVASEILDFPVLEDNTTASESFKIETPLDVAAPAEEILNLKTTLEA